MHTQILYLNIVVHNKLLKKQRLERDAQTKKTPTGQSDNIYLISPARLVFLCTPACNVIHWFEGRLWRRFCIRRDWN